MAALTFPLSREKFADLLRISSVTWRLQRRQEISEANGETLAADLGPALFEADVETPPMEHVEADRLQAIVDALDGAIHTFYMSNPRRPFPQHDPDGSQLEGFTPVILSVGSDNKSLALSGLPAGYTLTTGDLMAVDYSFPSRRALFRFIGEGSANSLGQTALIEVRPHVPPGLGANDPVYLAQPAAKMIMVPDSAEVVQVSLVHSVLRFSARQTRRAG